LFWLWVGFHFLLVIVTLVVAISLIRFWFRKDRR
jgi:heme/copper-type cytochrome/quinol oxidase subunit 3